MPSPESEPTKVPVNTLEAVDYDKPLVEQLQCISRLLTLANVALRDSGVGVELVNRISLDNFGEPTSQEGLAESQEIARMVAEGRLDELGKVEDYLHTAPLIQEKHMREIMPHFDLLLQHLVIRRAEIAAGMDRPHNEGGDTDGIK